jgi:hypothetical protein
LASWISYQREISLSASPPKHHLDASQFPRFSFVTKRVLELWAYYRLSGQNSKTGVMSGSATIQAQPHAWTLARFQGPVDPRVRAAPWMSALA